MQKSTQYLILELTQSLCVLTDICHWWCKLNFEPSHGSGKLQDKTFKQQVYFSSCLTLLTTSVSNEVKKKKIISMSKFQWSNLLQKSLLKSYLVVQICTVTILNNSNISKKIYLAKRFVQKSGSFKYSNFLNSKLHYANFTKYSENSCLLNHLQEHILPCQ